MRAADAGALAALKRRLEGCFEARARATGAELELAWGEPDCLEIRTNWPLAQTDRRNAESLGRSFFPYEKLPAVVHGTTSSGT